MRSNDPLDLLLLLLITFSCALSEVVRLEAPIGRLLRLDVGEELRLNTDRLPVWLELFEGGVLEGIPQFDSFGRVFVYEKESGDVLYEIHVIEETKSVCGEKTTAWIELMIPEKLSDVPIKTQIKSLRRLFEGIQEAGEVPPSILDFRLYDLRYLNRVRSIVEVTSDSESWTEADKFAEETSSLAQRMVFTLNISCGELNDYATEVISLMWDLKQQFHATAPDFRVVQGKPNAERELLTSTDAPATTLSVSRTTRRVHDNRPFVVNKLQTQHCKKGILCRLDVGENLFNDVEDGLSSRLSLVVRSNDEGKTSFLTSLPHSTIIEGVPLNAGLYNLRIEARDRAGQTASTPFRINVEEAGLGDSPPNHQFSMIVDSRLETWTKNGSNVRDFVYRLGEAASLAAGDHRPSASHSSAATIRLNSVEANGDTQLLVRWSNATLSRRQCQMSALQTIQKRMLRPNGSPRHEFQKAMGAQFHVRKGSMELFGSCLNKPTIKVRITTTFRSVIRDQQDETERTGIDFLLFGHSLLFPLILLAVLLIFCTLLMLLYCVQRRGTQKKKFNGATKIQGDFMSKGLPVVFPEEVSHGEDDDDLDSGLGVTTPMLVMHEQQPATSATSPASGSSRGMTLHENPIYKPPPVGQAQLVSNALSSFPRGHPSPPSTSTFAPQRTSSPQQHLMSVGGGSFSSSSPATGNIGTGTVGQRLPPPYVAAI